VRQQVYGATNRAVQRGVRRIRGAPGENDSANTNESELRRGGLSPDCRGGYPMGQSPFEVQRTTVSLGDAMIDIVHRDVLLLARTEPSSLPRVEVPVS
jgi:hypothetical protein